MLFRVIIKFSSSARELMGRMVIYAQD